MQIATPTSHTLGFFLGICNVWDRFSRSNWKALMWDKFVYTNYYFIDCTVCRLWVGDIWENTRWTSNMYCGARSRFGTRCEHTVPPRLCHMSQCGPPHNGSFYAVASKSANVLHIIFFMDIYTQPSANYFSHFVRCALCHPVHSPPPPHSLPLSHSANKMKI